MSELVPQLLTLAALAALVAVLVWAGRALARHRLRRLKESGPGDLWAALETNPDGRPTLIAFSTPSCAACHTAQKPALAELERRLGGGVRVIHVDAAARPEAAARFGILTVPATVVLDPSGQVATANQGFAAADRLSAQLQPWLAESHPAPRVP